MLFSGGLDVLRVRVESYIGDRWQMFEELPRAASNMQHPDA
jgi:hypothetical protein